MKTWVGLGLFLVGGALLVVALRRQEKPADPLPTVGGVTLDARRFRDLAFPVPRGWKEESLSVGGVLFKGPPDPDFMPFFQVYWGTQGKEPDRWFEEHRWKYKGALRPVEILEETRMVVAGMSAMRFTIDMKEPTGDYRQIDWPFAGPRGHGLLRATCTARQLVRYRPLFEEIARRMRYDPRR